MLERSTTLDKLDKLLCKQGFKLSIIGYKCTRVYESRTSYLQYISTTSVEWRKKMRHKNGGRVYTKYSLKLKFI